MACVTLVSQLLLLLLLLLLPPVPAWIAASLTMGMLGQRKQGGNGNDATHSALAAMRAGTPSPGKM